MSIANAKDLTLEAARCKYAIGAFGVTNLIQIEGVVDAAVEKRSPVILQVSVGPSRFLGADVLAATYRQIANAAPVPICLQLHHCSDVEYCRICADAGYTSVAIDASTQPYVENVRQTGEVVRVCHKTGNISVEGQLGWIGNVGEQEMQLADPRQAAEFVEATGVDTLAPAVGTAHGLYKTRNPEVDFTRLAEINRLLNAGGIKTPLVIQGSTGLTEDYIQKLMEAGGAKFDVSTELKRTLIDAQYNYMTANRQEYEPGRIDIAGRDSIRKAAGRWIQILGSAGKA